MSLTYSPPDWSSRLTVSARSCGDDAAAVIAQTESAGAITLSGGFPDPPAFPADRVSAVTAQLMVTSGGIDALGLLATSFIEAGDAVVVEAPTYFGAITAFRARRADVRPVPIGDSGLDVEALAALLGSGLRPKIRYSIPDHHNPTGLGQSRQCREQLVELCRRDGILLVEDVGYRELSFDSETVLSALDERMPSGVSWTVPSGGFFTWLTLPGEIDTVRASDHAAAAGVTYVAGPVPPRQAAH
ncbi:aminotransferase class I/II-fold pyridoxal phosphate-dependent enzyme [Amycolatopsis jejuensis]|uniref:aminotransferase class I/II-fold pyridoxal phosphate-dependent enzyme n=1 Tax=Amycolatopsis jejuensis TaxID=330084 RepID=UPI00068A4E4A|nr:aminotransferase class I/II-fold pyridoxal phosphate-dependent enzyme [Amycolatopsis jejuensis]